MTHARLRPDDVAIDCLRVKASRRDIDRLQDELTLASWPQAESGSWVFIRRVHAKAPRSRLAMTVVARTRRIMESHQGAADNGQVVRFATFAELLARLLADLAGGKASRCWYWQRWSHLFSLPVGSALARVMESYSEHLPTVTAELAKAGALSSVWPKLDREETIRLTVLVARQSGLQLPLAPIASETLPQERPLSPLSIPKHLPARWATTLKSLSAQDPRRILALILMGREAFPLLLLRSPLRLIEALGQVFDAPERTAVPASEASSRPAGAPQPAPAADRIGEGDRTFEPAFRLEDRALPAPGPRAANAGISPSAAGPEATFLEAGDLVEPEPRQRPETPEAGHAGDAGDARPAVLRPTTPAAHEPAERPPERAEPVGLAREAVDRDLEARPVARSSFLQQRVHLEPASLSSPQDAFSTRQGGLFFLLNFLKRDDVQTLIGQESAGCDVASGWGWLYRLGQELALDEGDPVVLFLARQTGLDRIEQMETLPPLPARGQVLALARNLYDRSGLWQPGLLRLESRIVATASHVDLYAALSSVRLPVRLAGLDLNPGWLPWLGRVVTFHYET